jgi:Heterokaryon incompatibility protein (HET)
VLASDDKLAMAHVYAPLKFPTSIRIFVLLPGHGSEPVEGELSERDLSDEEPYEAVSYTWGSGFPDSRIYIHDRDRAKTLMVYPALESALKALRLPGSPRRLWVDAICTNTLDCDERNRVLAMIPDIFQNACKVCVWLGEAAHDTVLAFQLIRGHLLQISELDDIISDTSLFPNWVAFSNCLGAHGLAKNGLYKRYRTLEMDLYIVANIVLNGMISRMPFGFSVLHNRYGRTAQN